MSDIDLAAAEDAMFASDWAVFTADEAALVAADPDGWHAAIVDCLDEAAQRLLDESQWSDPWRHATPFPDPTVINVDAGVDSA